MGTVITVVRRRRRRRTAIVMVVVAMVRSGLRRRLWLRLNDGGVAAS
jgi:hypothetical protein